MSRPKKPFPTYRRHSARDQGVADVMRHDGSRTKVYFPGPFGSEESKAAYQKLIAILAAHGGRLPTRPGASLPDDLSINELILRFLTEKVEIDYIDPDGHPTSEQGCFHQAVKPLSRLYGWANAREFDAASLEKVRDAMVTGSWMNDDERNRLEREHKPLNWSRGNINKSISRISSMFRWAVLKKMVPASVVTDLGCLPPLKKGRNAVRETEPVVPVDPEIVESTIPHLPPVVADMTRVKWPPFVGQFLSLAKLHRTERHTSLRIRWAA